MGGGGGELSSSYQMLLGIRKLQTGPIKNEDEQHGVVIIIPVKST